MISSASLNSLVLLARSIHLFCSFRLIGCVLAWSAEMWMHAMLQNRARCWLIWSPSGTVARALGGGSMELGYEPFHGVCQASCVLHCTLEVWNTLQHFFIPLLSMFFFSLSKCIIILCAWGSKNTASIREEQIFQVNTLLNELGLWTYLVSAKFYPKPCKFNRILVHQQCSLSTMALSWSTNLITLEENSFTLFCKRTERWMHVRGLK